MGLITIKTNYGKRLDGVYYELCKGRKRVAQLKGKENHLGIDMNIKFQHDYKVRPYWVTKIGCNSFGIEVYCGGAWVAIEQLTESQQARVVKAIDWSTLE